MINDVYIYHGKILIMRERILIGAGRNYKCAKELCDYNQDYKS